MSDLTPDTLADLRAELGAPRLPGMLIEVEPDDLAALLDAVAERDRLRAEIQLLRTKVSTAELCRVLDSLDDVPGRDILVGSTMAACPTEAGRFQAALTRGAAAEAKLARVEALLVEAQRAPQTLLGLNGDPMRPVIYVHEVRAALADPEAGGDA